MNKEIVINYKKKQINENFHKIKILILENEKLEKEIKIIKEGGIIQ
jgi:hypothetical protein